jgi:hypothetical protein
MKTVFMFSNPFGYGPSGKALSIAQYFQDHTANTNVCICGSRHILGIAGSKLPTIEVDDRCEEAITAILNSVNGDKYVISSQNRFAIKAAKRDNIPSAFLDGLAWFWTNIPADHFLADIIFWINYPGIRAKIPANYEDKIVIISGITESLEKNITGKRKGITFYIGGCKNPLTSLPYAYLDLTANLLGSATSKSLSISISTDLESQKYLQKYPGLNRRIKTSGHTDFLRRIARSELFVSNGGQTASVEAVNLNTPVAFYLPINLSQIALISKVLMKNPDYPALGWENYNNLPKSLYQYSEKQALEYFENTAKKLLADKRTMELLRTRFLKLIVPNRQIQKPEVLTSIGSSGAEDIFLVLKDKWGLT